MLAWSLATTTASADDIIIGLVTKTETNPFFVRMKEGAREAASRLGVELSAWSGRVEGDTEAQIVAIETLVAAGARGILITPSDPAALADAVIRARQDGVLVIALDTPFDPVNTVDGTFATDNFRAGELVGMWARVRLGADADHAKIATLDLSEGQITVDVLRHQGFLHGLGVDIRDATVKYDEVDPRIVGHAATQGSAEGGYAAMETLVRRNPDINLVHTINEPAAAGAFDALRSLALEDKVLIVSIDGGCPGVNQVANGIIGATAMQYPLRMASLGVEAVVAFAQTGARPQTTEGLDFFDTGVTLVTDHPVDGLDSITPDEALDECWG